MFCFCFCLALGQSTARLRRPFHSCSGIPHFIWMWPGIRVPAVRCCCWRRATHRHAASICCGIRGIRSAPPGSCWTKRPTGCAFRCSASSQRSCATFSRCLRRQREMPPLHNKKGKVALMWLHLWFEGGKKKNHIHNIRTRFCCTFAFCNF